MCKKWVKLLNCLLFFFLYWAPLVSVLVRQTKARDKSPNTLGIFLSALVDVLVTTTKVHAKTQGTLYMFLGMFASSLVQWTKTQDKVLKTLGTICDSLVLVTNVQTKAPGRLDIV